ncbi:MAG: hypothetical protein JO061_10595, partial [Acidobacteriaceae bacterium]|nr:hypothetical protein [Acidobacteriaceae bacterium]
MIRLFRVFIPASVVGLLFSETLLVLLCYVVASFFTTYLDPWTYLILEANYWKLLLVVGLIVLGMYFQDLYAEVRIISRILLVQQVCLSVGAALLLMAFLGYLRPELLLGRWLMIAGSFGVILVLPLWRLVYWKYIVLAFRSERVLLLGSSSILGEVEKTQLDVPEFGYTNMRYLC